MKYKEGMILNFSWNGFAGRMIKLHNRIRYGRNLWFNPTHTAIIGKIVGETAEVYEALNEGFVKNVYNFAELDAYIESGELAVGTVTTTITNVETYCKKYEGVPYGWLDIFYIGLYTLFGKMSFRFSTNAKKLICSEAISRILYDASKKTINFEEEFKKPYDLITPIDLMNTKLIHWG